MKRLLLSIFFLAASCANPIYSEPDSPSTQATGLSCSAKFASGECVSLAWKQLPTEEEFGSFELSIFRTGERSEPVDVPALHVLLWMPSMGHGSSPVELNHTAPGTYLATNVFFSMRGDWEIRVQRKEGQNVPDQAILPYRF